MSNEDDINPFADPSIRQATAQTFTNQQTLNEYNPFSNTTKGVKTSTVTGGNVAAVLPPVATKNQQPVLTGSISPSNVINQTTNPKSVSPTTRVDLSQLEKQQAELEERERRIAERERELRMSQSGNRIKNFPPFPNWFPCRPCFYQDINMEIPGEFQLWVRYLYYIWLIYSLTLAINVFAALAYFVVDKEAAKTFGLSLVYFALFTPCSYIFWFRPIYRAFREDSASSFMIFFFVFFLQIVITTLQALGIGGFGCGFILMVKVFSIGGKMIFVGLLMLVVTVCFGVIALADGLLLIKVHRLYRQSGATFEQAQREFQSAFVNNPTVRGAAREVAAAGINDTFRNNGQQQRPVH